MTGGLGLEYSRNLPPLGYIHTWYLRLPKEKNPASILITQRALHHSIILATHITTRQQGTRRRTDHVFERP